MNFQIILKGIKHLERNVIPSYQNAKTTNMTCKTKFWNHILNKMNELHHKIKVHEELFNNILGRWNLPHLTKK